MDLRSYLRNLIKLLLAKTNAGDLIDLVPSIAEVFQKGAFDFWWTREEIYKKFEIAGIHITRDHFYSPLPNTVEVADYLAKGNPITAAERLFDPAAYLREWAELRRFAIELKDIPPIGDEGFFWDNNFFPSLDAILYYCMIRRYRPRCVVEIGSGISTHIAKRAIRKNGEGRLVVIEPYPTPKLMELLESIDCLYEQKVQDVPYQVFSCLGKDDFLFVDSSHVSKTGSDLNHILFEILPRIEASAFVHFHDIFLPYEYPMDWVAKRGWAWNEQYVLLALLIDNAKMTPLIGSHLLQRRYQRELERDLKELDLDRFGGASLWAKTSGAAKARLPLG